MSTKGKWRKTSALLLAIITTVGLLAACGGGNNAGSQGDEQRVLRIAVSSGYNSDWGSYIRTEYTELFEFMNPNITVEFLENQPNTYYYGRTAKSEEQKTPMEILKEELEGANPPDLIIMEYDHLAELIRENHLAPLDSLMQDSGMNTDEFVPAVVNALKSVSDDGQFYALAPMFSSSVLAYNKSLFSAKGLPFPTDGMTWDEAFNLARQVSGGEGENKVAGFAFSNYRYNDIFYDTQVYTAPLELRYWDENGERMTVNTPEWKQAWNTILELKKDGVLPEQPDWSQPFIESGPFDYNSLLSGRVAMAIVSYWDITEIINANKNAANIENFEPIDWDIVSVPYHPEKPFVGGQMYLNGIVGISANAQNAEDAWKFIEFIMSERWAQQKAKSTTNLLTWQKYNTPRSGLDYNIQAFYQNMPAPNVNNYELHNKYPDIWQAQNIGYMKFQEVLNNNKTVEEALAEWENEGNNILQQIRENGGWMDYGDGGGGVVMPFQEEVIIDGTDESSDVIIEE
jgi:multiple sugar transport system substrate-binding protein